MPELRQRDLGYQYDDANQNCAHSYLMPAILKILNAERERRGGGPLRAFDLGCGNGSVANALAQRGYIVKGADASEEGIEQAKHAYPHLDLQIGSAYDDLAARFGTFPVVISLEVVEHLYFPKKFAACVASLLEPGGLAIISTPYNGYLKNLAIALLGGFDRHATVLWDHGHIKFWSVATLGELLSDSGLSEIRLERVGRIPILAKSMIAIAQRPM
jgi:2-polyprenyl-6-hydroxyphenyl methylase/3-demethylubiquinone-9 3-methyltransferase